MPRDAMSYGATRGEDYQRLDAGVEERVRELEEPLEEIVEKHKEWEERNDPEGMWIEETYAAMLYKYAKDGESPEVNWDKNRTDLDMEKGRQLCEGREIRNLLWEEQKEAAPDYQPTYRELLQQGYYDEPAASNHSAGEREQQENGLTESQAEHSSHEMIMKGHRAEASHQIASNYMHRHMNQDIADYLRTSEKDEGWRWENNGQMNFKLLDNKDTLNEAEMQEYRELWAENLNSLATAAAAAGREVQEMTAFKNIAQTYLDRKDQGAGGERYQAMEAMRKNYIESGEEISYEDSRILANGRKEGIDTEGYFKTLYEEAGLAEIEWTRMERSTDLAIAKYQAGEAAAYESKKFLTRQNQEEFDKAGWSPEQTEAVMRDAMEQLAERVFHSYNPGGEFWDEKMERQVDGIEQEILSLARQGEKPDWLNGDTFAELAALREEPPAEEPEAKGWLSRIRKAVRL